jgi:uncharacterized protein with HEPN domain
MPRDVAYLLDILEAAKLAATYVSAKTQEEFVRDTQGQDAVIRRLEIMAKRPAESRVKPAPGCLVFPGRQ